MRPIHYLGLGVALLALAQFGCGNARMHPDCPPDNELWLLENHGDGLSTIHYRYETASGYYLRRAKDTIDLLVAHAGLLPEVVEGRIQVDGQDQAYVIFSGLVLQPDGTLALGSYAREDMADLALKLPSRQELHPEWGTLQLDSVLEESHSYRFCYNLPNPLNRSRDIRNVRGRFQGTLTNLDPDGLVWSPQADPAPDPDPDPDPNPDPDPDDLPIPEQNGFYYQDAQTFFPTDSGFVLELTPTFHVLTLAHESFQITSDGTSLFINGNAGGYLSFFGIELDSANRPRPGRYYEYRYAADSADAAGIDTMVNLSLHFEEPGFNVSHEADLTQFHVLRVAAVPNDPEAFELVYELTGTRSVVDPITEQTTEEPFRLKGYYRGALTTYRP